MDPKLEVGWNGSGVGVKIVTLEGRGGGRLLLWERKLRSRPGGRWMLCDSSVRDLSLMESTREVLVDR